MPQRKEIQWSELKVGLVSLASIALLVIVIFLITGQIGFLTPKMTLRTYSPDAGGLKSGAVVRLAGVDIGNVKAVKLSGLANPNQAVEMDLLVSRKFSPDIREDSTALLAAEGLLGERYINISRGTARAAPIGDGGLLNFQATPEFSELVGGSRDLIDNLNVLTVKLNSILETIEGGQGTVGKLLADDSLYRKLDETVTGAQKLVNEITEPNNSVGRLISSDQLYNQASDALSKLQDMANKADSQQGTFGKLLQDPTLYQNAQQLVAKSNTLMDNINQGKGTLGKLVVNDDLHRQLSTTLGNLNTLLESINKGQGSMARLLHDPALYDNLNATSVSVQRLLSDFRQNPKKFLTIQLKIF